MKILLATDGSDCSAKAAKYLTKAKAILGRRPDIVLLNVDRPLGRSLTAEIGTEAAARYHAESSETASAEAAAILKRAGIPFQKIAAIGEPATVIARTAKSSGRELVVIGSSGHGALRNLLLGSVATKTLARSTVPVLVVR